MNIDAVFIPCAGKGTRMGDVGKRLPKPLWPLFDSTLLELQIKFFKKLGFKKIIINTHHLAEQFKTMDNVEILFEKKLLGSGGSLHNLKRNYPNLQKIIISNPDVFFNLCLEDWKKFISEEKEEEFENILLSLPCKKGEAYNELIVDNKNRFLNVGQPPKSDYCTYSGVGIINLKSFELHEGESSFFDSVINPNFNRTKVLNIGKRDQYWDFGTLEQYKDSHLAILDGKEESFRKLLEELKIFNPEQDYLAENCMNLGQLKLELDEQKNILNITIK